MPSSETVETGLIRLSLVDLVELILKISTQKSKVEKVQGGSLKIFEIFDLRRKAVRAKQRL